MVLAALSSIATAVSGAAIGYVPDQIQVFDYSGENQTLTIPSGMTKMTVSAWGAGGGVSGRGSGPMYSGPLRLWRGGGGGYTEAAFTVSAGQQYTIIVGRGGDFSDIGTSPSKATSSFGGGATCPALTNQDANWRNASGGGRSAVIGPGALEILTAGGGGAGGKTNKGGNASEVEWNEDRTGGAGGGVNGADALGIPTSIVGRGGSSSVGGAGGAGDAGNGSQGGSRTGGQGSMYASGGGGGYYGGGGGGGSANIGGGGGGGSSFVHGSALFNTASLLQAKADGSIHDTAADKLKLFAVTAWTVGEGGLVDGYTTSVSGYTQTYNNSAAPSQAGTKGRNGLVVVTLSAVS